MKAIRENGKANYSIVRRDRHPDFTFSGILRDRNGNVYEITDQESKDLFDTLIRIHHFKVEEDHTHTELIILLDGQD